MTFWTMPFGFMGGASRKPGIDWKVSLSSVIAGSGGWTDVVYAGGKFVAVNSNRGAGATGIATSSDGLSWTTNNITWPSVDFRGVAYGIGKFVAVASGGTNRVQYSSNASTWTGVAVGAKYWSCITYGGGKFVACESSGSSTVVMTSSDGVSWTEHTAQIGQWNDVAYGNGKFVAVSHSPSNKFMTSSDGETWSYVAVPSGSWTRIAFVGGMFIANDQSESLLISSDGVTWTPVTLPDSGLRSRAAYGYGVFVLTGYGGRVWTSADGLTWTSQPKQETSSDWNNLIFDGDKFVAIANSGTNRVMVSP